MKNSSRHKNVNRITTRKHWDIIIQTEFLALILSLSLSFLNINTQHLPAATAAAAEEDP